MSNISNYILCEYGITFSLVKKLNKYNINLINVNQEQLSLVDSIGQEKINQILEARDKIINNKQKHSVYELVDYNLSLSMVKNMIKRKISIEQLMSFNDANKLSNELNFKLITSRKIFNAVKEYQRDHHIINNISNYITLKGIILKMNKDKFTKETLINYIEDNIDELNITSLKDITIQLNDLLNTHFLINKDNYYYIYYPNLKDELALIKNVRTKNILIKRLHNNTLKNIGDEYHLSKERVRQIINKALHSFPKLKEDDYASIFQRYDFDKDTFIKIFNVEEIVYYYLNIRYGKGILSLTTFLDENDVSDEVEMIINEKLNVFKNEYNLSIEINKLNIILEVLKKSNKSLKIKEIINLYNKEISDKKLPLDFINNTKTNINNIDGILSRSNKVLASYNFSYRYYDIDSLDTNQIRILINTILLHTGFFSTNYFINKYPYIKRAYHLENEYELHNLLKKVLHNTRVVFLRMPHLVIDIKDKKLFFKEMIDKYSPISLKEFIDLVYELTGYQKNSFNAYLQSEFTKYINDEIVNSHNIVYKKEQYDKIMPYLKDNIYDIDTFEIIVQNCFNEVDKEYFNKVNFDKLGYKYHINYLFKNTYSNLDYCLEDEILKDDYYKIKTYNHIIMLRLKVIIQGLESNLDLIKIDDDTYLTNKGLKKKKISKNGLYIIIKNIIDHSPLYLNASYVLNKMNIDLSYLKEYHSNVYFINAILKSSPFLYYIKLNNNYLFSTKPITKEDFIKDCYSKFNNKTKMQDYLKDNFNIRINENEINNI